MPIQTAQCQLSGLAISKAKILICFSNTIYRSNFIKQHLETVMDWNYQNADCSLREKFTVSFIIISAHLCSLLSQIAGYHTHTHNRLTAFGSDYRVGQYQKKHSPTHTHPDRTSYYDPQHPRCSVYVHDSPLGQPLSRSSLVFLLVLDPLLHTPCISSPNHHVFAAHAHTNAASSAVHTKVQDITQQR